MRQALLLLSAPPDAQVVRVSSFFRTQPVGGPENQAEFINAAALVETQKPPEAVLRWLLQIERDMGRIRAERWGPRTIDLDLLLYDEQIVEASGLSVPHPRMAYRRFVLEPAAEVAPAMIHPEYGWTMGRLLDHLNTTPYLMAIQSTRSSAARDWSSRLAKRCGATLLDPAVDSPPDGAGESGWIVPLMEINAPVDSWRPRLVAQLIDASCGERRPQRFFRPTIVLDMESDAVEKELAAAFEAMR